VSAADQPGRARRLTGGAWGPALALAVVAAALLTAWAIYVRPEKARAYGRELRFQRAMFGRALEQPIAFSHRLHVTDKQIDCRYCHSGAERSTSAGIPSLALCLGCHNHIIPAHEEILKLKAYERERQEIPWVRVYYNPDHVFFPHNRHLSKGLRCQECHGNVETVDRLRKVTFYMGFCLDCHNRRGAAKTCTACHQ
jgi:hypothetical protein